MSSDERRTVGERGQVTIPKSLRERLNIRGGDRVVVREEGGKIIIEPPVTPDRLAEGYRRRADEMDALAEEFEGVSREADDAVGDAPEW